MTKITFDWIRDNVLKGMPSGLIATKLPAEFDIGLWQNITFKNNDYHINSLREDCSRTINIFEFDETATKENIINFVNSNRFELLGRQAYFVHCYVISTKIVSNTMRKSMASDELPMDSFSNEIIFNEYTIFVSDFFKFLPMI